MEFNAESLSFLTLLDWENAWNDAGQQEIDRASDLITELGEDLGEYLKGYNVLMALVNEVSPALIESEEVDFDRLLTVGVDDGGAVKSVLAAAIFNDGESGLVLKMGANLFRLNQVKGDSPALSCNGLSGSLSGSIKVLEAGQAPNTYIKASWSIKLKGIKDMIYIPVIISKDYADSSAGELEAELITAFEDGESIAKFLKPVPSGANFIKPGDLEIGEYEVKDIIQNKPHPEYGDSFTVVLANGDRMQTNKGATTLLLRNFKLYKSALSKGKPVTMGVTSREELDRTDKHGNPLVAVKLGFWVRAPRELYLPISHAPAQLPAAKLVDEGMVKQAASLLDEKEAIPF